MKNSLLTIFIGLSIGVSCSLNPKEVSKEEKTLTEQPVVEPDKDSRNIPEKKEITGKKQPQKNDTRSKSKEVPQDKKASTKNQISKGQKNKSKEKIPEEKSTEYLTKIIKVHGMVCAFCSNSIEKKFKKQKAVKSIKVDLESKKVTLVLKSGESFPDEKIKELIKASGFHPVSIEDKKTNSKQGSKSDQ